MNRTPLPQDLVTLVGARRVIPFVGAGVPASLGLPTWEKLLEQIALDVEGSLPFEDLRRFAYGNNLQIAEYLYLKSSRRMGPLRHTIEQQMAPRNPLLSGTLVELVNLGAPLIYTTNYDDLIEETLRRLGRPVSVVTLPRDVGSATGGVTQVVKFHGDLRHDETLVLTECSFYRRLDLESPVDLKFRSDLLGRSVLFMGYSFRDVNIRIIWYKLSEMMKDIPESERYPSYIVRLRPNPVQEDLDRSVGLRTITLDPECLATSDEQRTTLLADFLFQLSVAASPSSRQSPSGDELYVSKHLIESATQVIDPPDEPTGPIVLDEPDSHTKLAALAGRMVPEDLRPDMKNVYERVLASDLLPLSSKLTVQILRRYTGWFHGSPVVTLAAARLCGTAASFQDVISAELPWAVIWQSELTNGQCEGFIGRFRRAVRRHRAGDVGVDLAYGVDIVSRISNGQLTSTASIQASAQDALNSAADCFPTIGLYEPDIGGPPRVDAIIAEMRAADAARKAMPLEPDSTQGTPQPGSVAGLDHAHGRLRRPQ